MVFGFTKRSYFNQSPRPNNKTKATMIYNNSALSGLVIRSSLESLSSFQVRCDMKQATTKKSSSNPVQEKAFLNATKIDCTKKIRAADIDYTTVSAVINSWEFKILKIGSDRWARVTGESFLRHIFRLDPSTITLFGFPADTRYDDPLLSSNDQFVNKGIRLIRAIDMAASFLGPDLEPLEDVLYKLGWRHIAMKSRPEHWPIIGEALFCVFEECMIGSFTEKERQAWTIIYNFMGFHMIQGLKAHYAKIAEESKLNEAATSYASDVATLVSHVASNGQVIEKVTNASMISLSSSQLLSEMKQATTKTPSSNPVEEKAFLNATKIDCTKRIRASDIDYTTVSSVINSWECKILKIGSNKWARVTGESFLRHIFRLDPSTITLFGFPGDTRYDNPQLSSNDRFVNKGIRLIQAIDMAVSFLGPDLEPLEAELFKLGWRHVAMKSQPEHWPIIGEALFCVFEECMIGSFTEKERQAWTIIYNFMGFHMIEGLKAHYTKIAEEGKLNLPTTAKSATSYAPPYVASLASKLTYDDQVIEKPAYLPCQRFSFDLSRITLYRHSLQCNKKVPLSSISYSCVESVVTSWQTILNIPHWPMVTGEVFLRFIFKLAPQTVEMFGFPADTDYADPELIHNAKFMTKAIVLIKAIDTSVQLLGPDLYPLEEILFDLGKRHVMMKSKPEHWPIIGEALFLVFEEFMEGKFTGHVLEAWTLIYNFLGFHMIQGLQFQYSLLSEI